MYIDSSADTAMDTMRVSISLWRSVLSHLDSLAEKTERIQKENTNSYSLR